MRSRKYGILISTAIFLLTHTRSVGAISTTGTDRRKLVEWTRAVFPNPEQDPEACRSSFSRICDPDGLLGTKDKANLNDKIQSFEVMNSLSCSSKNNEEKAQIQLAVAIVKKMDLSNYWASGKDEAARDMAMGIHDDWGVGSTACGGTGILLFLSIEDRVIFISTGAAVKKVLTDGRLDNVIAEMGDILRRKDYGDALLRGIDEMEIYVKEGPPSNWPFIILSGGFVSFIGFMIFNHEREKRKYAAVRSQLSKLDRDRALALQGQYECTSCAICLADFASPTGDGELHPLTSSGHGDSSQANSKNKRLPTVGSDGRPLKLLRCGHAFDMTCWEEWITSGHGDAHKCPICKQDVAGSPAPTPSAPPLEQTSNHQAQQAARSYGRNDNYVMMGQPNYDMNYFEMERAFRLGRLSTRYPRYVRHTDLQRWTQSGYDGSLARDPMFVRSDPDRSSTSGSGGGRSGGGGSFGGGRSAGGRGGSW